MLFSNLKPLIEMEFDPKGMPGSKEIEAAVNKVIRKINSRTNAHKILLSITGSALQSGADSWNVDDIDIKVNDIDVNVDDMGRFIEDFSWDSDNYCLTIPESIIHIARIYVDDDLWTPKTYEVMKNTTPAYIFDFMEDNTTTDENYFTQIQNKIYFYTDLGGSSETSEIKILGYMDYPEVSKDEITCPDYCKDYLINEAIVTLASRPKNIISELSFKRFINESAESLRFLMARRNGLEINQNLNIW